MKCRTHVYIFIYETRTKEMMFYVFRIWNCCFVPVHVLSAHSTSWKRVRKVHPNFVHQHITNTQLPDFGTCTFWSQSSPTVSFWKNKHKPELTNLTLPTACFLSEKNTQKRNIWILIFRSTLHSSRYNCSDIPTTLLSNTACRDEASTCLGF